MADTPKTEEEIEALIQDMKGWAFMDQRDEIEAELRVLVESAMAAGKAAALEAAKGIVTKVCRDYLSDYYGAVRVEVNAAIDSYRTGTSRAPAGAIDTLNIHRPRLTAYLELVDAHFNRGGL